MKWIYIRFWNTGTDHNLEGLRLDPIPVPLRIRIQSTGPFKVSMGFLLRKDAQCSGTGTYVFPVPVPVLPLFSGALPPVFTFVLCMCSVYPTLYAYTGIRYRYNFIDACACRLITSYRTRREYKTRLTFLLVKFVSYWYHYVKGTVS